MSADTGHDVTITDHARPAASGVPTVERLIDVALFGPFDVGACVLDRLPEVVDRVRRELVLARFIGKLAVDQRGRGLRRRLEDATTPEPLATDVTEAVDASPAAADTSPVPPVGPDLDVADVGDAAGEQGVDDESVPAAADLALPDYDHLPAAHVIGKLAGLSAGERELIERYERAHRHRRTVLGKLDQFRDRSS